MPEQVSQTSAEPPHYVAMRLQEALAHDPRVNELQLNVKIVGDQVFVTGEVASEERCTAIGDLASEMLPNMRVHNQTTVVRADTPAAAEDLA